MSERIVEIDGVKLWTVTNGSGPPVLLCNGGAGCCDYLAPVSAMIEDLASVHRWEQRGCGRSEAAPPYDVQTCIADLEGLRRRFGHERWIVGGHSWGADLALAYALEHPSRVAGLLYISGGHVQNNRDWHREYDAHRHEEYVPEFEYPPNMEVNRQISASWKRYIRQPDLFLRLSRLDVPALFVYGSRDIRPSWPVEQVACLLPQARFQRVEGAEHVLWRNHSGELRHLLRTFMGDLGVREEGGLPP